MRTQKVQESQKIRENKEPVKCPVEIKPDYFEDDSPEITQGMIAYLNGKYRFWVKMREDQEAATLMLVARKRTENKN